VSAADYDSRRLAALGDLADHRVADDEPDPRDWVVVAADGQVAGRVGELIVDPERLKVCYLECLLGQHGGAALIPVGYARMDTQQCRVLVDTIDRDGLLRLPPYTGLPLPPDHEEALHRAFTSGGTAEETR